MLSYCSATDKGGKGNNEDAYDTFIIEHPKERLHLLAVADGLGGHSGGKVASKLAIVELIETIKRGIVAYESITQESMKELLAKGFKKANEEICYQRKIVPELHNMGTTLVVALLNDEGKGVVANVGDSRAYVIRDNIEQITKDHSYVQELMDKGLINQKEAATHPDKKYVTKIIGKEGVEPDFREIELGDDTLILCSDGLTDALSDEEIKQVVISSELHNICKNLVESAKPKSRDNITVIAARQKR
jgi:protein phosphatase